VHDGAEAAERMLVQPIFAGALQPVAGQFHGTRRLATGQTREQVHGLPEASVILAKSMPMSAVAGRGGEFGGGSAEQR
jgi:hypothetical protein